jgi:uncharacterized protein YwqG
MPSTDTPVRQDLRFIEAAEPIQEPITKFGGQPVWVDEPAWPLSTELGRPMRFVGQIRLPGEPIRLGYLFVTEEFDEDGFADSTGDSQGGENAFFAQPGQPADFYQVASISKGPTFGPDHYVELTPHEHTPDDEQDLGCRLWGTPTWLQEDAHPQEPGTWRFVLQLDTADDIPFDLDFGDDGIGYAFLDESSGEGRFLWQSG